MTYRHESGASRSRGAGRAPAATVHPTPATITYSTPVDLKGMTGRALDIWGEAHDLGYRRGYEAGVRDAEARHWALPSYSAAVDALIDLASLGIDRRERARRRAS